MDNGTETWRKVLRELGLALVTAGVVVLLFVAYELVGTNVAEQHHQDHLAQEFHHALATLPLSTATSTVPDSRSGPKPKAHVLAAKKAKLLTEVPAVPPGGALDHLQVPSVGIDRYVVEGVSEADLQMGPGHYPGTPLPGQKGNVGIAGHRTTFGAPFFELNNLVPGDLVYLTDRDGNTWVYKVQRQWVVPPSDVSVLDATPGAELTMTTCNPRFEASSRLVVRASLLKRYLPGTRLPVPLPTRPTAAAHVPSAPVRTLPATATTTSPSEPPGGQASSSSGDNPVVGTGSPVPQQDGAGADRSAAWAGALLWGALALACWAAARLLARSRPRKRAKALVVTCGALVCLVPLWFAFANVVNLLPANI